MRFLFDYHGTLEGNPAATETQLQAVLAELVARGHEVAVWTGGLYFVAPAWHEFLATHGIALEGKIGTHPDVRGVVVVDNDLTLLRALARRGAVPIEADDILSVLELSDTRRNPLGLRLAFCPLAENDHRKSKRQYAHTCHRDGAICVCNAFHDLPDQVKYGILLHELGHLLDPDEDNEHRVDKIAFKHYGVKVLRGDFVGYGNDLEHVAAKDTLRAAQIVAKELRLFD